MSHTLWSHGRLLGESELNYVRVFPMHRMGDFRPTELGEMLMPVITAVRAAALDLAKASRASRNDGAGAPPDTSSVGEKIRQTVEYADLASAVDRHDALDLELRAPDGLVIPTEWIEVCDTEFPPLGKCGDGANPANASAESVEGLDSTLIAGSNEDDLEGTAENDDSIEVEWPEFGLDAATLEERTFPRYQIQVMLSAE